MDRILCYRGDGSGTETDTCIHDLKLGGRQPSSGSVTRKAGYALHLHPLNVSSCSQWCCRRRANLQFQVGMVKQS